jgi:uncharacterized protein (UPF0335 family)
MKNIHFWFIQSSRKISFFHLFSTSNRTYVRNIYLYFITEEESFSTIKITKKTKNADSSPIYASLRGGGFSAKKIKKSPNPPIVDRKKERDVLSAMEGIFLWKKSEKLTVKNIAQKVILILDA